jgi:hypothetical protein
MRRSSFYAVRSAAGRNLRGKVNAARNYQQIFKSQLLTLRLTARRCSATAIPVHTAHRTGKGSWPFPCGKFSMARGRSMQRASRARKKRTAL